MIRLCSVAALTLPFSLYGYALAYYAVHDLERFIANSCITLGYCLLCLLCCRVRLGQGCPTFSLCDNHIYSKSYLPVRSVVIWARCCVLSDGLIEIFVVAHFRRVHVVAEGASYHRYVRPSDHIDERTGRISVKFFIEDLHENVDKNKM